MRLAKTAVRKAFGALGFELRRRASVSVRYENFKNLASVYERQLSERGDPVQPNEMRSILLGRLQGTPPSEAYFIVQALSKSKNVHGDVCEFGVAQGETSALIANEIGAGEKRLHLFDSFEGLPKPTEKDQLIDDVFSLGSMEAYTGTMSCPEDMVRSRLKAISFPEARYVVHKGFIEESLESDATLPKEVSFAYVDFDFYEPIKIALEFLHKVTRPGAIIIVDDYGFFSTGAKTATDEFVEAMKRIGTDYDCFVPDKSYGCFAVLTKKG